MDKLYENIRNRRIALGLTQQELADMLGYSTRSTIARIESGAIDLGQSKILQFAQALQTTPGELLGETEYAKVHPDGQSSWYGFPPMRLHDCRHFMASYLHSLGVPDAEIMRIGGWRTDHVMKSVYRHALAKEETSQKVAGAYAELMG